MTSKNGEAPPPAPVARAKRVTASVVEDAATVIAKVFDEAERRDRDHGRQWVALVDGNKVPHMSVPAPMPGNSTVAPIFTAQLAPLPPTQDLAV
jgi:hypothetical protein